MEQEDKVLSGAIVIFLLALLLNAVLGISAFEEIYRNLLIDSYKVLANDLKRDIEIAVDLEKPIRRFKGMNQLLNKAHDERLKNISVMLPDGMVLYSTDEEQRNRPTKLRPVPQFDGSPESQIVKFHDDYFIAFPVYQQSENWIATVLLRFESRIIDVQVGKMIRYSLRKGLTLMLVSCIVLSVLFSFFQYIGKRKTLTIGKYTLSVRFQYFTIIIVTLIIFESYYTYLNNSYFRSQYYSLVSSYTKNLANRLEDRIENLLQKNVSILQLNGIEEILKNTIENNTESKDISIVDQSGNLLYNADKSSTSSVYDNDFRPSQIDLDQASGLIVELDGRSGMEGFLILNINDTLIKQKTDSLLLDLVTVIFVSLILGFEILIMFSLLLDKKHEPRNELATDNTFRLIRPIALIFYFADAMPISFMPIFIKKLNPEAFWGISEELLLSLPISLYMLGVAVFLPVVGVLIGRMAIKKIFIMSGLLMMISFIVAAFTTSFPLLIACRFVSGMSFGGMVIGGQTFVVQNTTSENRAVGFGELMAGLFAGNICAVSIGSLVASRMGYEAVFLMGAILAGVAVLIVLMLIPKTNKVKKTRKSKELQPSASINISNILHLFRNRSFVAALVFENMPAQIVYIGFMFYVCPLYLNFIGISQASIGRALTGFGLVIIFLGPVISKLADILKNDRLFMIIGNLIIGLSLTLFFFIDGFGTVLLIIISFGLGTAMLASTEASFISLVREGQVIGIANVISVFRTLERAGQIAGPIIAGVLISLYQYSLSIGILGVINLLGILLFVLFSKNLRKEVLE